MIRLGYFTPMYFDDASYIGGGERYPLNLARGVTLAGGFEVDIFSYGPTAADRDLGGGVRLRVLPVILPPAHPLDPVSWHVADAVASVDLVHLHQIYTRPSELALLAAQWYDKPVFATDHGGHTSALLKEPGALALVDRVVAYSDFGAAQHPEGTAVTVIKGGVDADLFRPPVNRPPRDRFLFVGRLLPHKGIDVLIEALPEDLPLTVCGRPYNPDYFERIKGLARGKRVEFLTDATDAVVRNLYGRAWSVILPSVYRDCYGNAYSGPELMGFTLLEAMACGTPAICSRVGGMPEFIRHGETGFVFDSAAELTGQLRALAADPAGCDRMGSTARQVIEQHFDLRVCGRRLAEMYREMLELRVSPPHEGEA